jgi:hypothetical protein
VKTRLFIAVVLLVLAGLSCSTSAQPSLQASPMQPRPEPDRTLYGFFPSPVDLNPQSTRDTYQGMGQNADVALFQQSVPWKDFEQGVEVNSQAITDIRSSYQLAQQNGLEVIFVVDPLNGLNRREFENLPSGWQASFGNPLVRTAYTNFALRIVQEFHPRYLGLASEINTYQDTHPDDYPNFLSLYHSVYQQVKSASPSTQVFVTFQWEELNNLIPGLPGEGIPYHIKWSQIEAFEPELDVWAISTYPFIAFPHAADIKSNYYTPLLSNTAKPLAVAEGGFPSEENGMVNGTQQDQIDYLRAIHTQIGSRLAFWIYLLYNDLNLNVYLPLLILQGHLGDYFTLRWFASIGLTTVNHTPKSALAVWDSYRQP